ncbi:tail assembly chaperone [Enterobacter cloacae subsp. dissolvens]|nr:tail assembly chaperone [Enterobacter cloacae]
MIIYNFSFSGTETVDGYTVGILSSEDGRDWYESQALFDPNNLKIEFDSDGIITRMSMDVSELWPADRSVADVAPDNVPEGINEKGGWRFDGKKIVPVPVDYVAEAEFTRTNYMSKANDAIAPLQDAVDLGIATDAEAALLLEWKNTVYCLTVLIPAKRLISIGLLNRHRFEQGQYIIGLIRILG